MWKYRVAGKGALRHETFPCGKLLRQSLSRLAARVGRVTARTSMEAKTAVAVLAALAQETRLALFRHLVTAGGEGACAGAIASALGVPGPTLSFHLKELERAGIIASRREGRLIHYTANFAAIGALIDFLTEDCCGGHPEVCFGTKRRRAPAARERGC